ncbi:MAG: hypothetical protein RLZZ44_1648 [Bacteroidota bacterium]
MTEYVLHPRITENTDWATLLFLLCFATIAITKSVFEKRFSDFANLLFSDKYNKVYRESSNLRNGFTIALFFVQVASLAFFIHLSLCISGFGSKTDWMQYIQITNFLLFFILAKVLVEKIIATSFNINEFVEQFNHQKVTYRTYIGLLLLPINMLFFYYDTISTTFPFIIFLIVIVANLVTYIISIKNYQNLIFSKLFYFILYLCTLEIAPYYFMYYWFTKGIA